MSTLTLWTGPRRVTGRSFADFDTLVRRAFEEAAPAWPGGRGFVPAAEVIRDGEDALVRLELPGVDVARDVTVEVEGDRLVVRGERKDVRGEDRDGRASFREVRYGSFRRSFTLPAHVTADAVSAGYEAGVLSLRVVGAYAGNQARQIPVHTAAPAPLAEPAATEATATEATATEPAATEAVAVEAEPQAPVA